MNELKDRLQSENGTEPVGEKRILNSWKEIAAYLNRGVRTVQRWERERGLPIRRPRGKPRSAVIAIVSDIEAWMETRPLRRAKRRNLQMQMQSQVFQGGNPEPS